MSQTLRTRFSLGLFLIHRAVLLRMPLITHHSLLISPIIAVPLSSCLPRRRPVTPTSLTISLDDPRSCRVALLTIPRSLDGKEEPRRCTQPGAVVRGVAHAAAGAFKAKGAGDGSPEEIEAPRDLKNDNSLVVAMHATAGGGATSGPTARSA